MYSMCPYWEEQIGRTNDALNPSWRTWGLRRGQEEYITGHFWSRCGPTHPWPIADFCCWLSSLLHHQHTVKSLARRQGPPGWCEGLRLFLPQNETPEGKCEFLRSCCLSSLIAEGDCDVCRTSSLLPCWVCTCYVLVYLPKAVVLEVWSSVWQGWCGGIFKIRIFKMTSEIRSLGAQSSWVG